MRRRKKIIIATVAIVLIVALSACGLGYIGYFGGRILIPVVPTGATPPADRGVAVVSLSGDMGFEVGMGPAVAKVVAAHGLPVIGVNSLVYFRTQRTPAEAARLVSAAIARALALPGVDRVVVLGQSFGADMLQRALPLLPPAQRDRIILVGMTVPGDTIEFQATPAGLWSPGAPPVPALPSARLLTWVSAICIYGQDETDSLCPALRMPNVERVALPGGHPLHRDADQVAAVLIAAIDRAAARTLPKVQTPPTARP